MKRAVILLCVIIFSSIGHAKAEMGNQFWLLKGGLLWRDASDKPDSMTSLGVTYGYGLSQRFSFELDYDRSISGGDYKKTDPDEKGQYEIWMTSANLAYRYLFYPSIYFKAKAGFSYGSESRASDMASDQSDTLQGINGGLGFGYLAGSFIGSSTTIELSYAWHMQNITSAMLGLNLTF